MEQKGPLYYLKYGLANFNFALILALLFVATLPVTKKKYAPDLLIVVSPVHIWLTFMSLQPHKEESFLFSAVLLYEVNKLSGIMVSKTESKSRRY